MPDTDTTRHLLRVAAGFQHVRLLLSAMEQGVFAELGRGPRSSQRLRAALPALGEDPQQFLDALVVAGLLGREGSGNSAVYANTRDGARFLGTAFPGAEIMVLGCGPARHQTPALQQLISSMSGMASVGGVLVVMDCVAGDPGAEHHPVPTLERWCRDAGFVHTQILPLVAPVCAVLAHR
jgi:hypothetical protein